MNDFAAAQSFDEAQMRARGYAPVKYGSDQSLGVRFFEQATQSEWGTDSAGRPKFNSIVMVEIHVPGGKQVTIRRMEEPDKERFPRQWDMFVRRNEKATVGMPIEEWPLLTTTQVYELKAMGIFSVEQIAALPDAGCYNIGMGGTKLRTQARAFLEFAEESAAAQKTAVERDELRAEVDELKRQITMLVNENAAIRNAKTVVSDNEMVHTVAQESERVSIAPIPQKEEISSLAEISEETPYRRRGRPAKKEN